MLLTALILFAPQAPPPAEASSAADPLSAVRVTARLEGTLAVGAEARIVIDLDLGQASAAEAGIPAPILQLDVPPSVQLAGRELTDLKELARNQFMSEPYERLLQELPATVAFTLLSAPATDATIGINVIGYLRTEDGDVFLRRRLELPLRAGAAAEPGSADDSSWGRDDALLAIGDRAALFDLPRADGSRVALEQYLGDKNIVVTTYRAHW